MATLLNIPAWGIPRTEEAGGLQFMGVIKSQARLSDYFSVSEGQGNAVLQFMRFRKELDTT